MYEARCRECLGLLEEGKIESADVGVYVGETSRTLLERASEHVSAAENIEVDNFIVKHWASKHRDLATFPRMQFKVIKQCKDALTRQVSEAIWIENCANLNSKAEWGKNSLSRLVVDGTAWEAVKEERKLEDEYERELQEFKEKKKIVQRQNAEEVCLSVHNIRGSRTQSMVRKREEAKKDDPGSRHRKRARVVHEDSRSPKTLETVTYGNKEKLEEDDNEVPVEGKADLDLKKEEKDDNEDPVGGKRKVYEVGGGNEDPVVGDDESPMEFRKKEANNFIVSFVAHTFQESSTLERLQCKVGTNKEEGILSYFS